MRFKNSRFRCSRKRIDRSVSTLQFSQRFQLSTLKRSKTQNAMVWRSLICKRMLEKCAWRKRFHFEAFSWLSTQKRYLCVFILINFRELFKTDAFFAQNTERFETKTHLLGRGVFKYCRICYSCSTGFLPLQELHNTCRRFGVPAKQDLLRALLEKVERNDKGEANYQQFLQLLNWRDSPGKGQAEKLQKGRKEEGIDIFVNFAPVLDARKQWSDWVNDEK